LRAFAVGLALSSGGALCPPGPIDDVKKMNEMITANARELLFASDADGDGHSHIYKVRDDGQIPTRVGPRGAIDDRHPCWIMFRSRIAFIRRGSGVYSIWGDGTGENRLTQDLSDDSVACSRDGLQIAFSRRTGGNVDIWAMTAKGEQLRRLTDAPAIDDAPAFSPGGDQIVFQSDRDGKMQLYVMNAADGTGVRRLTNSDGEDKDPSWSLQDKILFRRNRTPGIAGLYVIDSSGANEAGVPTGNPVFLGPVWSPDGTQFLFIGETESGNRDVFINTVTAGARPRVFIIGPPANNIDPSWTPPPASSATSSPPK
jgi:Tol biopolymer transport system component